IRCQGDVRRHRGSAQVRSSYSGRHLHAEPPPRDPRGLRPRGRCARPVRAAAGAHARRCGAGAPGEREVRSARDGRDEPPLSIRRASGARLPRGRGHRRAAGDPLRLVHVQPSRNLVAWRLRRQEAGGGAFLDLGLQLLDLGLWLAAWPAAKRIAAHTMGPGKDSVEDMATALVVCENGLSLSIDVSWRHMGEAERFWFDLVGTKGSARVQPLRVFKELHGSVTDVTPTGASGRETPFAQSYRAEWTYFLAVMKGDVNA